jgi:hypothetical protein
VQNPGFMISIQSIIQLFFETSPTGWTNDKFDKEWLVVILARKLEIPVESLQTKVEQLQHENSKRNL